MPACLVDRSAFSGFPGSELIVDLDENGEVSGRTDDFRWRWSGGEEGQVSKADDDDDLQLAYVAEGSQAV